ncbi:MAG: hypothetical protein N3B15_08275 [Planctomycetota bacterium]|nr:hypothetical protein [Planctomycetota bacterium]
MARRCFTAYSTWALHDELGDRVHLSEALVLAALDELERRWRPAGYMPEFFNIDYGWTDPELGYRHFHRQAWPQGPTRVFERIRAAGMLPGLWYAVNGGHLKVPGWEPSRSSAWWHFSLVSGPYADDLADGLLFAAEVWGVRFFKFDFADFAAGIKGDPRSAEERYALGAERFVAIVERLRRSVPDCITIAHCGFARHDPEGRLGPGVPPLAADPGMLEVIDGFFSGDPQLTDLPMTAAWRSCDLYQDVQVRALHAAGFPLHRIEDHGALCGDTNTALRRGRRGLRRSQLASLARGGRRDLFYGDPRLPRDEDLRALAAARRLFQDAWARGLECSPLGGPPGLSEWHGWLTGGGRRGLAWIVNPHLVATVARVPLLNLERARVLWHDGAAPTLQSQPDALLLALGPEQAVLIGLGQYADPAWQLPADDEPLPRCSRLLPLAWRSTAQGLEAAVPPLASDEELVVAVRALDGPPQHPGPLPPCRFAKQHDKDGVQPPESQRLLVIEGEGCELLAEVPAVSAWNGTSWVLRRFRPGPAAAIRIVSRLDPPRRLRAEAWALRW